MTGLVRYTKKSEKSFVAVASVAARENDALTSLQSTPRLGRRVCTDPEGGGHHIGVWPALLDVDFPILT